MRKKLPHTCIGAFYGYQEILNKAFSHQDEQIMKNSELIQKHNQKHDEARKQVLHEVLE